MAGLLEAAAYRSIRVTPKQVARWRSQGVLPPPISHGRGRGRGVARSHDDATVEQLGALTSILKRNRSLDYAAFRLWLRGYNVHLDRVRRALRKLVVAPLEKPRRESTEELTQGAFSAEEKAATRRAAPKQTRKMAREGKLAPTLLVVFQLLRGSTISETERDDFVRDFAALASIDKARTGVPALGIPGWLTNDPSNDLRDGMNAIPMIYDTMQTLTDEELLTTRGLYLKFERMVILMQFIQKAAKDEDALGMGLITHGPLGSNPETMSPLMFAALAVLIRAKADVPEKINEITAPVEVVLQQFREAGIAIPDY